MLIEMINRKRGIVQSPGDALNFSSKDERYYYCPKFLLSISYIDKVDCMTGLSIQPHSEVKAHNVKSYC